MRSRRPCAGSHLVRVGVWVRVRVTVMVRVRVRVRARVRVGVRVRCAGSHHLALAHEQLHAGPEALQRVEERPRHLRWQRDFGLQPAAGSHALQSTVRGGGSSGLGGRKGWAGELVRQHGSKWACALSMCASMYHEPCLRWRIAAW